MDALTSKTKINLFDVLAAAPFMIGAVIWISVIYYKVDAQGEQIQELRGHQKEITQMFQEIRERLIRLEEQTQNKGR